MFVTSNNFTQNLLFYFEQFLVLRPNRKRSLLRLTRLNFFTGGRSVFFGETFLHVNPLCQPLLFQVQGTVTLVDATGSLAARRTSLPESPRRCVGRLESNKRVTSSSPLSRASSARAPIVHFRRCCEKGMVAVCCCFVRSLGLKWEACNSKTRYLQVQPQHREQCGELGRMQKRSTCRKASCPRGSLQKLPLASPYTTNS